MSHIRSPWCVITVLAEYRRCRADFKIKSTSCGLKPRNSSMFWASAERNCKALICPPSCRRKPESGCWVENGQEENLVLNYLDSPQSHNTVRFNRLKLQGSDERANQVRLSAIRASLAKRRRHPEW